MKQFLPVLIILTILLAACATGGGQTPDDGSDVSGLFGSDAGGNGAEPGDPVVLERNDVQRFRGTEMVKLLSKMTSANPGDWSYVRRHVFPAPEPPTIYNSKREVVRRNFDWPPEDPDDLTDEQREYRSFLLWPEHIRELLLREDWDEIENRDRLADYGRMYELLYEFQTRRPYRSPTRESEYWREFAESMLAYGEDGEELLVANMIVALSSPEDDTVYHARDILVQIGPPAIKSLCAALWTLHRQLMQVTDPETGETGYKAIGNPDFNEHIVDTLYRIGSRAAPQAVYELENSLDNSGKAVGSGWRFRKYFIELIGKLGATLEDKTKGEVLQTLEAEIDRVVVEEYDADELAEGNRVIDPVATDDAQFVFHEHLIQAIGNIRDARGLRAVIRLWEKDEFHEMAALQAIFKMTGKKDVRSISGAKELARSLDVKLDE